MPDLPREHIKLAAMWTALDRYRYDIVAWAEKVLPFGKPGPFEQWSGLWPWQEKFCRDLGEEYREKGWGQVGPDGDVPKRRPIQRVICSCTGSGKTAMVLPLVMLHYLAVFPAVKIICGGPSREQIGDKLAGATKAMINASPILSDLFTFAESGKVGRRSDPDNAFAVFRTARQKESMHGTHSKVVAVIIDEASGVDDEIWDATAGARRDEQALVILSGNPTQLDGFFGDRHSGHLAGPNWPCTVIPADTLPNWDESQREDLIADLGGVDSETYRATVLAKPPLVGSNSFIPRAMVEEAMERPLVDAGGTPLVSHDTPLVAGVDLARGGSDSNVAVFRAGMDARSVPPLKVVGRQMTPREKLTWMIEIATRPRPPYGPPCVVYVDSTAGDGQLEYDLDRAGYGRVFQWIRFSDPDPSKRCLNRRAQLWVGLRMMIGKGLAVRRDRGLMNTILAAKAHFDADRLAILKKEEFPASATEKDEVDALMLSCLLPPFETTASYATTPAAYPQPEPGTSWMGA